MKRGDFVVLFVCLALAGVLALPRLLAAPRAVLVVTAPGLAEEYPLHVDRTRTVHGVVITLRGGKARVLRSPCADKRCVKAGWRSRPGDMAVCLPQRVAIQVKGRRLQNAGERVDGVAY
jgi:hypothetical protein